MRRATAAARQRPAGDRTRRRKAAVAGSADGPAGRRSGTGGGPSGPFLIRAFRCADANLLAFGDEGRHLHHQAGFELGGLGHVGYRRAILGLSPRPRLDLVVNVLTAKAMKEKVVTIYNGEQWRPFLMVTTFS